MATKDQVKAAFAVTAAVAEAIRGVRSIPSGQLYAMLMDKLNYESYEGVIRTLVRADLVEERGNVLYWVGPTF